MVRPTRRVPVFLDWLARHAVEVETYIRSGAVTLQSDADSCVDVEEFRVMLSISHEAMPEVAASPVVVVAASEPLAVEPLPPPPSPLPEDLKPEAAVPAVDDVADAVEDLPATKPDIELPEGWERSSKAELSVLAAECGVALAEGDTARMIKAKIQEWAGL